MRTSHEEGRRRRVRDDGEWCRMLENEITGASTRAAWAWLGALSAVTGHRGVPRELRNQKSKTAGRDGTCRWLMAKPKAARTFSLLGREEAQEQKNGHDEGPPWVWRCPAARRGEVRRLRGGGKEPSRGAARRRGFRLTRKEEKPEEIVDYSQAESHVVVGCVSDQNSHAARGLRHLGGWF